MKKHLKKLSGVTFRNETEKLDPVPLKSPVAFKRPLSAAERVRLALKTHDYLRSLDALPGDDSLDGPPIENMAPHQLTTDPETGEEMTAAAYVMLQEERSRVHEGLSHAASKFNEARRYVPRTKKKKKVPKAPSPSEPDHEESGEDDND